MTHTDRSVRAGGAGLTAASVLMIAALAFHGPIDPDLNVQMTRVADAGIRWSVVHWIAAAGLSLYAVSGLVVLSSQSRLTDGLWTTGAWAVFAVGSLCTMSTAVAETTVVTNAALSGSNATFRAWWAFSEGMANGFAFLALAVAVIAGNEARDPAGATPGWWARTAMTAGFASFIGWAVGMWFGVALGNLLWLAASMVMCAWTLWFGLVLTKARSPKAHARHSLRESVTAELGTAA